MLRVNAPLSILYCYYQGSQHNETQHNDTQHNNIQHKELIYNTQHTRYLAYNYAVCRYADADVVMLGAVVLMLKVVMLGVAAPR